MADAAFHCGEGIRRTANYQGKRIGNTALDNEEIPGMNFTTLVIEFAKIYLVSFYLSNGGTANYEGDDDVVQVFAFSITLGILEY